MKTIVAIIPCYNESLGVAQVIRGFPVEQLRALNLDLKIIVIDNNSTDDTAAVARAAGATVVGEPMKGKGHAIRRGFTLARGADYVVMLDGDNTYRAEELLRLIEPLHSGFSDVVIGSRLDGRVSGGAMRGLNRLGNVTYSRLVKWVHRIRVTDVLTGYVAWRGDVVQHLLPHLHSPGFAIEMEMVAKMARLGYAVTSVPITYDHRAGESSLRPFADGARILGMFMRTLTWTAPATDGAAATSGARL